MIVTRLLALAGALVVLGGASPAAAKVNSLYALRYGANVNLLLPYDPVRLVPSGPAIRMGHFASAWSVSPDRTRFVAAAGWRPRTGQAASIRFVNLAAGRVEGTVSFPGEFRRVTATAWIRGRVLVVVSGSESTRIYSVDPRIRAVVSQVDVAGTVVSGERAQSGLVLLLARPDSVGPATVAVVDQTPPARTIVPERVRLGATVTGTGQDRRTAVRKPALALGPSGLRAYLFGAGEPAASIDLRRLAVRYAPTRQTTTANKQIEGSVRTAMALPDGRLVVGGFDYGGSSGRAAALSLVDPKDWSRQVLDPAPSWYRVAGGLVFARGRGGVGLRILYPSGAVADLFRTGSVASVTVIGPRAFITFFGTNTKAAIVELGSRRVVRHTVPANLLSGRGQQILG